MQQNPEVKKVLLSTGDLVLRPDHHQGNNPPAAWQYYDILTEIRGELAEASRRSESFRARQVARCSCAAGDFPPTCHCVQWEPI